MKKSKLIIVAGMSGAGKSTTSQQLAKQYARNNIEHIWLHEEIANHPIRQGEFEVGSLDTEEGMAQNIVDMYERWAKLTDEIDNSSSVYIMEGCLYQNIVRYFFPSNYPLGNITAYYDRVMEIIDKLNPTVVFLYRSDVKASFEQAFAVRGERWKKLILDPEGDGYFQTHEYTGDDSTYAMYDHQQQVADMMFERYQGSKIKLCTSDGQWDKHMRELTEYLGLTYMPPQETPALTEPQQYCGRYVLDIDGRQNAITIKLVEETLYCQLSWWSNMKLIPCGNHEFEVLSFPIQLAFHLDGQKPTVDVTGIYDWGISGKTLVKE